MRIPHDPPRRDEPEYFSPGTATIRTTGIGWLDRFRPGGQIIRGDAYFAAKRMSDLIVITLLAPLALPLFVLVALAIKIESPRGPVLFTQARTGRGGVRFQMLKFRSMVPNAENLKLELGHLNELQWPDFKITDDPRVTRVGRLLRKTSLDELPQLINVLRGEMTLVGPRPTSFSADTYRLWHTERLDVVPGLTGLWQIIARGESEFDERLRLDIAYIERRCLWLDFQILARTAGAVFSGRGRH